MERVCNEIQISRSTIHILGATCTVRRRLSAEWVPRRTFSVAADSPAEQLRTKLPVLHQHRVASSTLRGALHALRCEVARVHRDEVVRHHREHRQESQRVRQIVQLAVANHFSCEPQNTHKPPAAAEKQRKMFATDLWIANVRGGGRGRGRRQDGCLSLFGTDRRFPVAPEPASDPHPIDLIVSVLNYNYLTAS
ncbi:hypothetical protein DAEQUDRAFT_611800 [Daedalea quercina L-15889]|uniref:Uncharacterized protein n=1 Tax=Daedalea quercina L-15889 TaxID=1314783 RepID=A0A165LHM5_9APHY|nr:hypothetical protein DAEQUDRAFT_611800 [Daedalea quercina L-15889]